MVPDRIRSVTSELSSHRILVTGGTSGIGKAVASLFASRGAKVAILARNSQRLDSTAKEIGATAWASADISDPKSAAASVASIDEQLGGLTVLVHAAGISIPAPLGELDSDTWRETIDINLSGTYFVTRDVALRMRERDQDGSIVIVGSAAGHVGLVDYAHYCASKAGQIGLVRALALELAPRIRVNAVCPGAIDTPMLDQEIEWYGGGPEIREKFLAGVPLERVGTAAETAALIAFLAIDATYATGAAWMMDGGMTVL